MKIDRHIGILSILLQKDTVTAPEKLRTVIRHPVKKEAVCPIKIAYTYTSREDTIAENKL